MNDPACALSESCDLGRSAMLDSKLEPQPGEGSGDNNCSMPRNKIPHDEGSGVEVHLSHLQADDPGSGVALANADRERLDNHDDGSRDNNISMALNTMPPDGHLVQAGESGDPCHLKRPGDSKNHVRTTVIGGCNNSAPIRSSKNIASRCILQDTKAPQHTTCENGRFIFFDSAGAQRYRRRGPTTHEQGSSKALRVAPI